MKFFLIIFLSIFHSAAIGQICENLEGRTLNCRDKDSLKQGFWYEYYVSEILTTDSFRRNPDAIGLHNDKGLVYTPVAEGFYKNNIRIGSWKYYVGFYNDPFAHEKTVIFTDSGYRYEIDSFYHYSFKVSNDTSLLTGKIHLKNDTVNLECKNGLCKLYNPFTKKNEEFDTRELVAQIRILNFRSNRQEKQRLHADKLVPKDFEEIFSLALNFPQLQQYYHVAQDSSGKQVVFKDFGKANHNNLLGVTKFNKQVLIMTEDQLKQNKIKNYFVVGDWVCGDNSVRLQLEYIGEGLLISYMFKKVKEHWTLVNSDLTALEK